MDTMVDAPLSLIHVKEELAPSSLIHMKEEINHQDDHADSEQFKPRQPYEVKIL